MTNKKTILTPPFLGDEERDIIESYRRGDFEPTPGIEAIKADHEQTANNTLTQKKALSIRLQVRDIGKIKDLARKDGIGYQTLISSIVHRYAEGTLKRID